MYGYIYVIRNKVNNKLYIGQTKRGFNQRYNMKGIGIEKVYNYHLSRKNNNDNYNTYLLRSIEKYGFDNFEVEERFDCATNSEELNKLEYMYIRVYNTTNINYGYNLKEGGDVRTYSEHSKLKDGVKIVCLNDSKFFKSYSEASKYYGIPTTYIKASTKMKFYKSNYELIRFRKIKRDFIDNEKLCYCCGRYFKYKSNNQKYCSKECSSKVHKRRNKDIDFSKFSIYKIYYYKELKYGN